MTSFFVAGRAVTQGSMQAVGGRVFHTKQPELMAWREAIRSEGQRALEHPLEGPVALALTFRLPRPASAPKRVTAPSKKPDIDKLARAALDGGTGVLFLDDAQVCSLRVCKRFALPDEQLGVEVRVSLLHPFALT